MGDSEMKPVGDAVSALITENAIVPNAIVPNAIVPNAIVPNAIVPNALSPGTLDSASLAAIQATGARGDLSRMFLKYLVGCALDPAQSFSFSWTDAANVVHNETYWGSVGLAPGWASAALTDETKQRLVSGCLAGRTNYYGTSVTISMRAPQNPLKRDVPAEEMAAYPDVEGAFWGNLFTSSPYLYACYNAANEQTARAALRVCATGVLADGGQLLPCGAIALAGACDAVCPNLGGGGKFYTSCSDPPGSSGSTNVVITTALP
ncbi:MAG: hypothetical protein QM820_21235 [Minicystis sp.]